MAIDIIARGLTASLIGSDGKIASSKMPTLKGTSDLTGFYPLGKLTDPTLVEGRTVEELLMMMLYGVVNPTFTEPTLSIAISEESLPLIIGRPTVLKGTLTFDRGTIHPAYGTSGYRAGAPIRYMINEYVFDSTAGSYDFEIPFTPTDLQIRLSYQVAYAEGEQPINSAGQPFGAPYPAGTITQTLQLQAAYAMYNADTEEVPFTWFIADDGQGYASTFASEGSGKQQTFAISDKVTVVGIKAYDVMTQQWTWLGGQTAAASLTHFDTTIIKGDSLGETNDYVLYTHNQPASGERELRIYIL